MAVLLEPFSETEIEGTPVNSSIPEVARDEAEPSHQPHIVLNSSLESSIQNRILNLEKDETPFLLGKERGLYWKEIRESLHQAPSQGEYSRLLEFENRDLQIRELKHSCNSLFQEVLYKDEGLAARAPYNPGEALIDFFDESRDELDTHLEWSSSERDRREIEFLARVEHNLKEDGPSSLYIKKIFGII
jgi:hypothetical protein